MSERLRILPPTSNTKSVKFGPKKTDRLLNMYFRGVDSRKITSKLDITREEAINCLFQVVTGSKYKPTEKRKDRSGTAFVSMDNDVISHGMKAKNKPAYIARVLARSVSEVKNHAKTLKKEKKKNKGFLDLKEDVKEFKRFTIGEDLLLAYRFLYYVYGTPIISDTDYDHLEKEELNFGSVSKDSPLNRPGSDNPDDYPKAVKALAIYLRLRYGGK